jgi:transcriptional regulator with XRE-family HTH domain
VFQNREAIVASLRRLREQRGLGLRELARRIDAAPGVVSLVERGLRGVPPGLAMRWALELHISTRQLFLLAATARVEHRREIAAQELARILAGQPIEEEGKS